mmetsp:Transcript_913/g.1532  ORF Transcript_913/g.1532 Transcript_913/m.1532 type:complete len:432 (-) Transcript_913:519-1814(-)
MPQIDALRLLGLHRREGNISFQDVVDAYNLKAHHHHPDHGGEPFLWGRIQAAYDTLRTSGLDLDETGDETNENKNDEDESSDDYDLAWTEDLSPFDLYGALGLTRPANGELHGGGSRIRAAFHQVIVRFSPTMEQDDYATPEEYADAVRDFRRASVAFVVLRDEERRRIYDACGFLGLRSAEVYQQDNVFEMDAWSIREHFFSGEDGEDREYLLLNGSEAPEDVLSQKQKQEACEQAGESDETEDERHEEPGMLPFTRSRPLSAAELATRQSALRLPPPPPPQFASDILKKHFGRTDPYSCSAHQSDEPAGCTFELPGAIDTFELPGADSASLTRVLEASPVLAARVTAPSAAAASSPPPSSCYIPLPRRSFRPPHSRRQIFLPRRSFRSLRAFRRLLPPFGPSRAILRRQAAEQSLQVARSLRMARLQPG